MIKKVFSFLLIAMFLVNTSFVSAGSPLHQHTSNQASNLTQKIDSQAKSLPCHDMTHSQQSDQQHQHCKDMCLCSFMSCSSSVFIIFTNENIRFFVAEKPLPILDGVALISVTETPPTRPPKYLS